MKWLSTSKDRGFTLVEVLVTLTILSVIAVLVYTALHTTYRVVKEVEGVMDLHRPFWGLSEIISADIRGAYLSQKDPLTLFEGDGASRNMLSLTTFTPYQPKGPARMVRVDYTVVSKGDKALLVRKIHERDGKAVDITVLLEGIEGFRVWFLNKGRIMRTWDSKKGLPEGVRVVVSTEAMNMELLIKLR